MNNGLTEKRFGITDRGKKIFADFLTQSYKSMNFNQARFAAWLTETTGIKVSTSQIQALASGHYDKGVAIEVYAAIELAGALKHKNGDPYTISEMVCVLREQYDPATEQATSQLIAVACSSLSKRSYLPSERKSGSPYPQRSGVGKDSAAMERSGIANQDLGAS